MKPSLIITIMNLAGLAAVAQVPSGLFQYDFSTNSGLPLWNFSGTYPAPYYLNTNDTLQLHQDGRGRLTGSYQATHYRDDQPIGYFVGTQGSIRSAGTNINVHLASTVFLAESSLSYFHEIGVRRQDKLALVFEPATMNLTGTDRVTQMRQDVVTSPDYFSSSHTKNLGGYSYVMPVTLAVPEQNDGSWTLKLEMVPAGNKLSGTGTILFSNGQTLEFQLIGSYSPAKQTSKVLLLGLEAAKGARLVISMTEPDGHIISMRGTVAAQKLLLR